MKKILTLFLLSTLCPAQVTGDYVFQKKIARGWQPVVITPENGKVLGWTSGNLANMVGGGAWGSITGTLSAQTDLNTALGLRAPLASPTFTGTLTTPNLTVPTNASFGGEVGFTGYSYWFSGATFEYEDGTVQAAHRTALGLGTLATQNGTFSGTSSGTNTGDNATNTQYSGLAASKANLVSPTFPNDITVEGISYIQEAQFSATNDYTTSASFTAHANAISSFKSAFGLVPGTNIVAFNGALGTPTSGTINASSLTWSGTAAGLTAGNVTNLNLGSATSITGGGTIALGGFTATIPATGTVALRAANTFTGVQTLPAGAVGSPAINFGDATTGFYQQASDRLGVTAAGSLKAVFYSSGMYMNTGASFGVSTSNWFRIGAGGVELTTTAGGGTYAPLYLSNLIASGTLAVTGASTLTGGLILPTSTTPASASAAGVAGTVCRDADYIYVCTATNTWKRVAIATW